MLPRVTLSSLLQPSHLGRLILGQHQLWRGSRLLPAFMPPVVDLTFSDSDSDIQPAAAAQPQKSDSQAARPADVQQPNEADQRKRIMDFAQSVAAKRQQTGQGTTTPLVPPPPPAAAEGEAAASTDPAPASSSGAGANSLLAQLAREREARRQQQCSNGSSPDKGAAPAPGSDPAAAGRRGGGGNAVASGAGQGSERTATAAAAAAVGTGRRLDGQPVAPPPKQAFSIMTYNVWFQEEVALEERMDAIGQFVIEHQPTLICLQEVTPLILQLFASSGWWDDYTPSPAPLGAPYFTLLLVRRLSPSGSSNTGGGFRNKGFGNSRMGRGLLQVELPASFLGAPLVAATSHLESPCPPNSLFTQQRQQQAAAGLELLDAAGDNVLWAGDMNWTDSRDGELPLGEGWVDVWQQLRPGEPGFTYHTAANPMLTSRWPGSRLDRVLAKLSDWRPTSIALLGTQPLPGVTTKYTPKNATQPKVLPVLPSDHFGLLVMLEPV